MSDAVEKNSVVLSNYVSEVSKTNYDGFLSDKKHGFVPGRSCTTQLLEVLDKRTEILDRGGNVDVIYLDLVKAFGSVHHHRLLLKLSLMG